jgi:hypothetical protein
VSGQLHVPAALPPGKEPLVHIGIYISYGSPIPTIRTICFYVLNGSKYLRRDKHNLAPVFQSV